jgi:DNA-binding HxlR family transcriptional regulator
MRCGTTRVTIFDLLGDPWILALLGVLRNGEKRFTDLQRDLQINPITLSNRLKTLEENRIVQRLSGTVNKQAVSYRLTELGRGTFPVLDAMETFGAQFSRPPSES